MLGTKLTFQTLATTRNEAAIDVLVRAMDASDRNVRAMAVSALTQRNEPRAAESLLDRWMMLTENDLKIVRSRESWIAPVIKDRLKRATLGETEGLDVAIDAARVLRLTSAFESLVLLAESSGSRATKNQATEAILDLVAPLGFGARAQRDQATIRGPILSRLADSTRRFSMHRNERLVDAFLIGSTWGDGDLRLMVTEKGPTRDLLLKRLSQASHQGVIELLAGFIRRRKIDPQVLELMQTRTDNEFRDELLDRVSREPSGTVQRNLRDMGMPKCCQGGPALLHQVGNTSHAALIFLYGAANVDSLETMHLIIEAVKMGGKGCIAAAAIVLTHIEPPDIDFWMRAAVPVADNDEQEIEADENARLLRGLVELLEHPEPSLVRGVRGILAPMHAEAMLPRLGKLRPRSRRRLGRVIMMIDPEAIDRVRDALRHPVLNRRLEAIATADALALVDLLSDSFAHISKEDHQAARVQAAEVMANACGQETMTLLEEMLRLPESPVRDAAERAVLQREKTKTR